MALPYPDSTSSQKPQSLPPTTTASLLSYQPHSLPPHQSRFASLPSQQQSYTPAAISRQQHSLPARPQPQSFPISALPQQPYSTPQASSWTYTTPQAYTPYQPVTTDTQQQLPYPQSYPTLSYESTSSTLGAAPTQPLDYSQSAVQQGTDAQYPQTAYPPASYPNAAELTTSALSTPSSSSVTRVFLHDGEDPQSFDSAKALADYLKIFPEADNDQGCRVFRYGPKCSTNLLMSLFEHFDFTRYSLFPYGFAGDFSTSDQWGAGSCKCQKCLDGQLCGHYVLQKNLRFYAYQDVSSSSSTAASITSSKDLMTISSGDSQLCFHKAEWNLQFFRFRSRRLQTTVFAFDALIYQNYESETKVKSAPLDYVFNQLDLILSNWDSVLNASLQFLSFFRVEVLEERLETDRSIIRNLLIAAQHWEEFRRALQVQLERIEFLENVHGDPRWTEGRDNYYELLAIASRYVQRFRAVDYRITTELMQETDNLIQRVTNLITIDEGYRSRDMNESIRRLTWITFIFLPLIFTAGIFSMQVDLFNTSPAWRYYIYTSLILMFIVFSGYAMLRSKRRLARTLRSMVFWLLTKLIDFLPGSDNPSKKDNVPSNGTLDLEKQPISSRNDMSTVLKWAASSGRTDVIRGILQTSTKKTKLTPGTSGQALLMAIQNTHFQAASLLINTNEGLSYTDEDGATVLHWAARKGQSSICQLLLEKGLALDVKDQDGLTAMDWAMKGDDEKTINVFLKRGNNFIRQETANLQSLHLGARSGDIDMIKNFRKHGSSLEARDAKGQTVLFHAVKGKQHHIVQWLLEEGNVNVQAIDKEGLTVLHVAAQGCDLRGAELLVRNRADINALSSKNLTPLLCIPRSEGVQVLRFLQEKGADVNAMDKDGNRITHKAATKGQLAFLLFKVAIDLGADINAKGRLGNTPAHLAAESGSKAILGILAQKGIEFRKVRNSAGYTSLMMASRAGQTEIMRHLLETGDSYNVTDNNGKSLIALAIEWGNPEVIAILQEYGASFTDMASSGGNAHPIWKAVYEGQGLSVAKILDGGLSVEYEHRGVRLLQLAIEVSNVEVVRLLLERGATVDVPDMRGWTALHSAAYSGNVELMLRVLQKTDNKEPVDQQGWTPLDLAAFYKHDEIKKLLDPEGKVMKFAWMSAGGIRINATSYYQPSIGDSVVPGVVEAPGYG